MNTTPDPGKEPSLNPSLKRRRETEHDTTTTSPAPADSASVQRDEGRAWPMIWLIVTLLSIAVVIYLVLW